MSSREGYRGVLLDSHAWVEIFKGTKAGKKVRVYIRGKDKYTSAVNIAEVERKVRIEQEPELEGVRELFSFCNIIGIDRQIAESAAELSVKHKLHLADALVYACARARNLELITGDPDLKGLKGVGFYR